jgi:CheY-like chemotaxis protein
VLAAGNRAKELVKQILTFSRHNAQDRKPLSVQFIIKEAMKLLRPSIPTTIKFEQDIDTACQPVLADPTQIHQVILNLCTNAYQAMRETGGVLNVSLKQIKFAQADEPQNTDLKPGDYVKLRVSDTGPGMTDEIRERIFEPYFTTKGQEEGTGLGLAVVHGIIANCHGAITVHSEIGHGTCFDVYLPVIKSTVKKDAGPIIALPPSGDERVLLVDDDTKIVEMEKAILTSLGYDVTPFASSTETLALFRKTPNDFDVLITDMTMPNLTGADLARECLAIRPDMPIILCTGFSEIINEEKAKKIGICEYLMKPASKMEIALAVRAALGKKSQKEEK